MRKLVFTLALVGATAFIVAPSGATYGKSADTILGAGFTNPTMDDCEDYFGVAGKSGPNGENPQGLYAMSGAECGVSFVSSMDCLRVEGNRASMLARFTKTRFRKPTYEGGGVRVFFEDNGNPYRGVSSDRIRITRMTAETYAKFLALGCPAPQSPPGGSTQLVKGNIIIDDD